MVLVTPNTPPQAYSGGTMTMVEDGMSTRNIGDEWHPPLEVVGDTRANRHPPGQSQAVKNDWPADLSVHQCRPHNCKETLLAQRMLRRKGGSARFDLNNLDVGREKESATQRQTTPDVA